MMLIVDSGSTKSDWVLLENQGITRKFSTMGFNPFFHNETAISNAIKHNQELYGYANNVNHVYYYGAGCSSPELKEIVVRALSIVFESAEIHVDHDLMASAYATYSGEPCIACILGTGSNSIYMDDEKAYEEVPALAYILGDEGSGSYYGKRLLRAFLYKKLPQHLHDAFEDKYGLDKNIIFEHVYTQPNANVYLASFMKFISDHKSEPFFREMIIRGMRDFMQVHVCCFPNFKEVEVNFVGSISHFFEEELRIAAKEMDIHVGKVIRRPILGLVNYHINKEKLELQSR